VVVRDHVALAQRGERYLMPLGQQTHRWAAHQIRTAKRQQERLGRHRSTVMRHAEGCKAHGRAPDEVRQIQLAEHIADGRGDVRIATVGSDPPGTPVGPEPERRAC